MILLTAEFRRATTSARRNSVMVAGTKQIASPLGHHALRPQPQSWDVNEN